MEGRRKNEEVWYHSGAPQRQEAAYLDSRHQEIAMTKTEPVQPYNYAVFSEENVYPLMHFENSPRLGVPAPDFPLWDLDEQETTLSSLRKSHLFTVVEFGSFT
jgi:hypothetical protein